MPNTFTVFLLHFSLWGTPHQTLWQEELEFAAMRIEALKLARQIALSSLRSKVPALCLPCVCECAQPGEPSAACPGAPWGIPAACWQQSWHRNAVTPLTPQLTTGKKQQQRSFQLEMDSAVQVCHFSGARFVLKYLMVKNTRPALAIRTFCLLLVFSAWSQTPLTLESEEFSRPCPQTVEERHCSMLGRATELPRKKGLTTQCVFIHKDLNLAFSLLLPGPAG